MQSTSPGSEEPTLAATNSSETVGQSAERNELTFLRLITTSISARLLIDIGAQMFNPFLPVFAAGLGINAVTMGRLVSLRSSMGLLAPLIGALADRVGYRLVMRVSLLVNALGMWTIGAANGLAMTTVGMILLGLGLTGFVPTLQAYLSIRLPYAQRARGMGMLEYSWALTGIIGLSLMGYLIAATSWRTPFFLLGGGLVIMAFVFGALPAVQTRPALPLQRENQSWSVSLRDYFAVGEHALSAWATIVTAAANYYAAMQFMIVHGLWYATEYGLQPDQLGLVALLFGCFDLVASVSVSLFTDRFGKRRSVLVGTVGALAGYLLIPLVNVAIWPAVLSAALARGFFEFAIVSHFPLLSGQTSRAQRAKVMTLSTAISLGVATIAAAVAPAVYTRAGIGGVAAISTACSVVALLMILFYVRENTQPDES